MKLTRITITGADDHVDPRELVRLSAQYPFVEWGLLASESRAGAARYPTAHWLAQFGRAAEFGEVLPRSALHLCGELSRRAIAGRLPFDLDRWRDIPLFWQRVQLNGFSQYRLPMLGLASTYRLVEFILQVQSHAALLHARDLYEHDRNVAALWDVSGGEGIPFDWEHPPELGLLPTGFAGGIGPDNLQVAATFVRRLGEADEPTWLDGESGWRTGDEFDLDKVRSGLARIAPWIIP